MGIAVILAALAAIAVAVGMGGSKDKPAAGLDADGLENAIPADARAAILAAIKSGNDPHVLEMLATTLHNAGWSNAEAKVRARIAYLNANPGQIAPPAAPPPAAPPGTPPGQSPGTAAGLDASITSQAAADGITAALAKATDPTVLEQMAVACDQAPYPIAAAKLRARAVELRTQAALKKATDAIGQIITPPTPSTPPAPPPGVPPAAPPGAPPPQASTAVARYQGILSSFAAAKPGNANPGITPPYGQAPGDLAGVVTDRTRGALLWFQKQSGLLGAPGVQNGELDASTCRALDAYYTSIVGGPPAPPATPPGALARPPAGGPPPVIPGGPPMPPPAPPMGSRTYTVVSGDTPGGIAARFTGSSARFPELAASNPAHAADILAGKIYVSEVLTLPATWPSAPGAPPPAPPQPGAPPPVVQPGAPPMARTYTVVSGDTPAGIAARFTGSTARFTELAAVNPAHAADILAGKIYVSEVLAIPPTWPSAPGAPPPVVAPPMPGAPPPVVAVPSSYTVVSGDTPGGIAARFTGSSARFKELAAANPAHSADILAGKIYVSEVLALPASWLAPGTPPAPPAYVPPYSPPHTAPPVAQPPQPAMPPPPGVPPAVVDLQSKIASLIAFAATAGVPVTVAQTADPSQIEVVPGPGIDGSTLGPLVSSFGFNVIGSGPHGGVIVQLPGTAAAPPIMSSAPGAPAAAPVLVPPVYSIKSGDSPSKIAQSYTGDGNRWRELLPLNPDKSNNISKGVIYPGQTLKIPPAWLTASGSPIAAHA